MKEKFYRTLIVSSYAPPASRGAPLNMYHLFKNFPPFYYILTSYYNIHSQDTNWLKGKYIFYDKLLLSGKKNKNKKNKTTNVQSFYRPFSQNLLQRVFKKIKYLIKRVGIVGILTGVFIILSQILMMFLAGVKIIKKEKIELIIGFSDYGPALIATYLFHLLFKKPYYIFLFDLYKNNFYPIFPAKFLACLFEPKILKKAKKIFVTNEGTRQYYEKTYKWIKGKIFVIYNSACPEIYLKHHTPYQPKPPYKIVFTGAIYWAQLKSIKNLIQAVKEIEDIDLYFNIYCPDPKEYLNKIGIHENERIKIYNALPFEMPKIQTQADILFLPLSWHKKGQKIIDTATPGKLSDYLISNRPILIHAPPTTFLVKYAKENNFALVVDEENIEKLKIGIKKLLFEIDFAKNLIKNAQKIFFKNHDANKNSYLFLKHFYKEVV